MKKILLTLVGVFIALPAYSQTTTLFSSSNTGNVGIGTTSPLGTLDVEGGTAAASTNGSSINLTAQSAGSGNKNGGNIILTPGVSTGTGTPGYVGIGTATPATMLDIYSNGGGTRASFWNGPSNVTPSIAISSTAGHAAGLLTGTVGGGIIFDPSGTFNISGDTYSKIVNGTSPGGTNYMTINPSSSVTYFTSSAGNVGIGTSLPQATLDIAGYTRLQLNSSAPAICSSSNEGAIALTHLAQACVCDTTPAWHTLNTSTACSW